MKVALRFFAAREDSFVRTAETEPEASAPSGWDGNTIKVANASGSVSKTVGFLGLCRVKEPRALASGLGCGFAAMWGRLAGAPSGSGGLSTRLGRGLHER